MRIRKTYQTVVPTGKVLNSESSSLNDTYSCDYINTALNNIKNNLTLVPVSSSILGDSQTSIYDMESSLTQFYVFINSHVYNFELVVITHYDGESKQFKIFGDSNTASTISYSGDKLTITGSNQCRGVLYKVTQKTA